jgi:hypothetical protein
VETIEDWRKSIEVTGADEEAGLFDPEGVIGHSAYSDE